MATKPLCCGETHPAQRKTELVGEALAPLRTTVGDDLAAAAGLHTSTETALARAANFGRTIGRLHNCLDLIVKLEQAGNQFSRTVASGKFLRGGRPWGFRGERPGGHEKRAPKVFFLFYCSIEYKTSIGSPAKTLNPAFVCFFL